ncbi:AraC family transcriptional regulator [Roseibium aquae]|uniref:AraC family transcriptional regulator n=1 Tax=Roseibium aquae TaxID=1323746 RepID=A0A916TCA6_9HYPH|nr:helix-turn-helix transcriptional regulator [Roseibium aquae]GGB37204.1 AraC family transcriptional regulator [Roseibium aquae]
MGVHPDLFHPPPDMLPGDVVGFAKRQQKGTFNKIHAHLCGQLFHVIAGTAAVETEFGTFFVPPERALWIPAGVQHHGRYLSDTEIRFLYIDRLAAPFLPDRPVVVQVTALLRELILEFMTYARSQTQDGPAARIAGVILDQLKQLPAAPLQLPMPREKKLRSICDAIVSCPADMPSLAEAASRCALSTRSFERRIKAETGMSYRTWTTQVKLFRALELLASGRSVSEVAFKLGYEGPSAFVATFKKSFGITPGRYFTDRPSV